MNAMNNCIFMFYYTIWICTTTGTEIKFPKDFKFGVATASYQIEGGWNSSGKGENIWDRLTHEHPNWIKDKTNGDVACDSYHKWKEDVKILTSLGINFYRFSLSWSRILPTGFPNKINPDGIRYYNNLINELLKNKIEPYVTLFHWDLPQPLQDIGGWPNPYLSEYFAEYAKVAFKYFGDRVKVWITFNEPIEICESGYALGDNAPALKSEGVGDYLCGKTLLLAHATAYHLYNDLFRKSQKGKIGITINSIWAEPKTQKNIDIQAAARYMLMNLGWWSWPIFSKEGDYHPLMKKRVNYMSKMENFSLSRLPEFTDQEIKFIKGTADFFGLNHYSTWLVEDYEFPLKSPTSYQKDVGVILSQDPNWKNSSLPWLKVVPWGFRKLLNWIRITFNNPNVYVTENGFSDKGGLNDQGRIEYHKEYMKALLEAIHLDGCNIRAYTIWSLMDNMEWREGYTAKFGLYQVDFSRPNRTRMPKASASFYKKVVSTRIIPGGNEVDKKRKHDIPFVFNI